MLNRIRHTSLLLLGCLLSITGCGGGPSDAEIEAIVEARVAEERASFLAAQAPSEAEREALERLRKVQAQEDFEQALGIPIRRNWGPPRRSSGELSPAWRPETDLLDVENVQRIIELFTSAIKLNPDNTLMDEDGMNINALRGRSYYALAINHLYVRYGCAVFQGCFKKYKREGEGASIVLESDAELKNLLEHALKDFDEALMANPKVAASSQTRRETNRAAALCRLYFWRIEVDEALGNELEANSADRMMQARERRMWSTACTLVWKSEAS